MTARVPVPSRGAPLRASWGAAVADGLNALQAMSAPGLLARDGVTGCGVEPLPANRRDRKGGTDLSCFRLGTIPANGGNGAKADGETQGEKHAAIVSCYYNVGGVMRHAEDFDVSQILPKAPAEGSEEEEEKATYLCFKLEGDEGSIVAITEDELETEQRKAASYILPLYRYVGATLADDLRTAPQIQYWEDDLT